MKVEVSAQKLVESGAHFGHMLRRTNPKMKRFQYTVRDGNFIFDLIKTKGHLEEALELLTDAASKGKKILIVGTKKQIQDEVVSFAKETGSFWVSERWLGGTFTNFDQIKRTLTRSQETKVKMNSGEFKGYTKKEKLMMSWAIEKTEKMMGGLTGMEKTPDIMIVIDTKKEFAAVNEAKLVKVPVIGIVDSNGDPDQIDYPIPANDDATASVSYILSLMKDAIMAGKGGVKKTEEVKAVKKEKVEKKETKVKEVKAKATKAKKETK